MNISIYKVKIISILYLALPVLVFFTTWLRLWPSLILVPALVYIVVLYIKNTNKVDKVKITFFQLAAFAFISMLWLAFSGNGGLGFQADDHMRHTGILKMLYTMPYPAAFSSDGKSYYLASYLGYYILAPLFSKVISWTVVSYFMIFWAWCGVSLGLFWFCTLIKSFNPIWLLSFIFFSGIDIGGFIYNLGFAEAYHRLSNSFYEIQPFFSNNFDPNTLLLYQANTHCLYWSIQHAVAAWLGGGLFFYELICDKNVKNSSAYLCVLPFWSPFIFIGILPYFIWKLLKDNVLKAITIPNLLTLPILITLVWFLNSVQVSNLEKGFIFYKPARLLMYFDEVKNWILFLIFEIGCWFVLIYAKRNIPILKKNFQWIVICFITLCLIPLYRLGIFNDWCQRVSMPSLFLMLVFAITAVKNGRIKTKVFYALIVLVTCWDPVFFIALSLKITNYKIKSTNLPLQKTLTLHEAAVQQKWPIDQFFAPAEASFFKYLGKEQKDISALKTIK